MALKTIVACLTAPESASTVAAAALQLAERHQAHLIGLHVIPQFPIYSLAGADLPLEVINWHDQALAERAKEVEKLFTKTTKDTSAATEWQCVQSLTVDLATGLLQNMRCADLIVMSQFLGTGADPEIAAEVVIGAGRPVLIIPNIGEPQQISTRAVIAWNGEREAARAAFDTLPLLKQADSVDILTIDPDGGGDVDSFTTGGDLALALSRQGIKVVTATSQPMDISVGDDLLSRIADKSCSLLVMGCYGHSRLRELVFGGVTKHILKHMTVPVLMSH